MIYDIKINNGDLHLLHFIEKKREKDPNFSVIDVGGSANGWTRNHINALIDINQSNNPRIKEFNFNITDPKEWIIVEDYVNQNGKFDFSICTHTLEDISSPKYVCDQLSKISYGGYISTPSKYAEFDRKDAVGNYRLRGYIHHRWIFSFIDNRFTGFPKVTFVEADPIFENIGKKNPEYQNLCFFWEDHIELDIINNDYLGPSVPAVINMYRKKLFNDDLDKKYSMNNFSKI